MKLAVLMENTGPDNLAREHGLSVYINYSGRNILLDAGQSSGFLKNAKALRVDITNMELAVLSHGHYDHGDGLAAFLAENSAAPVYLRPQAVRPLWYSAATPGRYIGLSQATRDALLPRQRFVEDVTQLAPGVWAVPDAVEHEQSLVLEGERGLVVLNSCCHAGAGHILRDIQARFPTKPLHALVGGLHLMGRSGPDSLGVAPGIVKNLGRWLFDELGLEVLYTGHCTGAPAYEILREAYPRRVHPLTTGLNLELE